MGMKSGLFAGLAAATLFAAPALAQDCTATPSDGALESQTQLSTLLDDGYVQFAGYLALVAYAQSADACADREIFEQAYVRASQSEDSSIMVEWENWSRSPLDVRYPRAAANDGFGSECTVRFDLPQAGTAQNVSVDCTNPLFKSPIREGMRQGMWAPPHVGERFTPAEGLSFDLSFSSVIQDWVF